MSVQKDVATGIDPAPGNRPPLLSSLGRYAVVVSLAAALTSCETTSVSVLEIDAIEISPGSVTLLEGQWDTLVVTVREVGGRRFPERPATWTVDDPDVLAVNGGGVVEALSRGATLIHAQVGGTSGSIEARVLPAPEIALSTSAVRFSAAAGDGDPRETALALENAGAGSLQGLEVETQGGGSTGAIWLEAVLLGRTAPTQLRIRAYPGGLAPGTYHGTVRVTSPNAEGRPAHVSVRLDISHAP